MRFSRIGARVAGPDRGQGGCESAVGGDRSPGARSGGERAFRVSDRRGKAARVAPRPDPHPGRLRGLRRFLRGGAGGRAQAAGSRRGHRLAVSPPSRGRPAGHPPRRAGGRRSGARRRGGGRPSREARRVARAHGAGAAAPCAGARMDGSAHARRPLDAGAPADCRSRARAGQGRGADISHHLGADRRRRSGSAPRDSLRIQGHAEPARDALADLSTRGDAGGARRSRLRRRRKRLLQPAGSAPGGERRDRFSSSPQPRNRL